MVRSFSFRDRNTCLFLSGRSLRRRNVRCSSDDYRCVCKFRLGNSWQRYKQKSPARSAYRYGYKHGHWFSCFVDCRIGCSRFAVNKLNEHFVSSLARYCKHRLRVHVMEFVPSHINGNGIEHHQRNNVNSDSIALMDFLGRINFIERNCRNDNRGRRRVAGSTEKESLK